MLQLVPIAPSGPIPENVSQIEFMIISGVELSAQRLQEVFEQAKGIKVWTWHSTLPVLLRCFPEWVPQPEVSCWTSWDCVSPVVYLKGGADIKRWSQQRGLLSPTQCHSVQREWFS